MACETLKHETQDTSSRRDFLERMGRGAVVGGVASTWLAGSDVAAAKEESAPKQIGREKGSGYFFLTNAAGSANLSSCRDLCVRQWVAFATTS